jgi:hypothetical protein
LASGEQSDRLLAKRCGGGPVLHQRAMFSIYIRPRGSLFGV